MKITLVTQHHPLPFPERLWEILVKSQVSRPHELPVLRNLSVSPTRVCCGEPPKAFIVISLDEWLSISALFLTKYLQRAYHQFCPFRGFCFLALTHNTSPNKKLRHVQGTVRRALRPVWLHWCCFKCLCSEFPRNPCC